MALNEHDKQDTLDFPAVGSSAAIGIVPGGVLDTLLQEQDQDVPAVDNESDSADNAASASVTN